ELLEDRSPPAPPSWRGLSGGVFSAAADGGIGPGPGEHTFLGDEEAFRSAQPRTSHWSIAWSDLMMTMFVLFLSLFVYQATHREFLVSDEIEVIGGETADALEITDDSAPSVPFVPIRPAAPLITAGIVKKVEPIRLSGIDTDLTFFDEPNRGGRARIEAQLAGLDREDASFQSLERTPPAARPSPPAASDSSASRAAALVSRAGAESANQPQHENFVQNFIVDKELLEQLELDEFASINLVPDHTMRITLTGDLLFAIGRAELSPAAIESLQKIASVIKDSPYMINVVGHTDNVPMQSSRYETNWELSVARASRVARFLIENMGMDPHQFVVSGYGAERPLHPNADSGRRAANRRVEIIISRRLPDPLAVSVANHLQNARETDEI
ncbi:MAG: OmpA family protein, partial [Desulfofustis sp.]|nr:OmpA family protein [Desulfofustis sp.]